MLRWERWNFLLKRKVTVGQTQQKIVQRKQRRCVCLSSECMLGFSFLFFGALTLGVGGGGHGEPLLEPHSKQETDSPLSAPKFVSSVILCAWCRRQLMMSQTLLPMSLCWGDSNPKPVGPSARLQLTAMSFFPGNHD